MIPVKNGAAYLPDTLPAILSQEVDCAFEVLVIDSGSRDRSLEILAGFPVRLVCIPPHEFNHGDTRNLGIRLACSTSRYIVFLSQDAQPYDRSWLANLLAPLRQDERVAGVFSRHIPRPNASVSTVRQLVQHTQSGGVQRLVKEMPASPAEYEANKFHYIFFSNTSSALRRSVWQKIPFRRADFGEDAQWADQVLRQGYRIVFEPASMILHSHSYPLSEQFRQNVDHAFAMNRLFRPSFYHDNRVWLRLFAGIPLQVWRDSRFLWNQPFFAAHPWPRKLAMMLYCFPWHLATISGSWVGAHLEQMPPWLKLRFSRQARLQES
ncbi:MAG: glycosyltransferase family 2 protein [Chloroflexota bacterium]